MGIHLCYKWDKPKEMVKVVKDYSKAKVFVLMLKVGTGPQCFIISYGSILENLLLLKAFFI